MASLLDMLIFDAVYGSWILSLPLFTLGMVVLYIRDHGGLGFLAQQYHPKKLQLDSIDYSQAHRCIQSYPKPFQQISMKFQNFMLTD